ncbi:MAG: ABC transporter ATP-binding protein [Planctomycetaceae bacterium]|nr:ABC transporter ATP-binding protein [Planctomycetaceae bacterium]
MSESDNSQPVIDVEKVTFSFKEHRALERVTFQVWPGTLHGFVGPNGAGKTTTLKLICTLLRPQLGRVTVFGHDVREDMPAVRRRLGFMPDHFSLYRQMTVFEYLDFFAAAYGFPLKERDRIVSDVLALTDMDGRRDSLIQSLSRGLQQRVSLARVLVNDPDLLLLDEPASGLDPRARIELMEILRALREMGKTIFISSHILTELAELCDSVTIIDRGTTRFCGPMDELLRRNAEQPTYKIRLESPANGLVDTLRNMLEIVEVTLLDDPRELRIVCEPHTINANTLLNRLMEHNVEIVSFGHDQRHLNEAFMHLTQEGVRS